MEPPHADYVDSSSTASWETCSLISRTSTNATDDDLDGLGRTLGNLYGFAGRHLERGLTALMPKLSQIGHGPAQPDIANHHSHPHDSATGADLDFDEECCSLVSSISSNATADDLPGAGRTIGLFYTSAGSRLEYRLGKLAEKMGRGPRMASVRIQRRRMKALSLSIDAEKNSKKNAKVQKDAEKLLKYVHSPMLSTRVQALERIVDLVVDDHFIRNIFLAMKADQILDSLWRRDSPWTDFSPELLSSSRKALLSITDTDIHLIARDIGSLSVYSSFNDTKEPCRRLKQLLSHPDTAFLVIRYLKHDLERRSDGFFGVSLLFGRIVHLDEIPHDYLEWSTLDQFISWYLKLLLEIKSHKLVPVSPELSALLEFILRYPERLPSTIGSEFFIWFSAFDNTKYSVNLKHAYLTIFLLRGIAFANDLQDGVIFYPDLASLRKIYEHPAARPLLHRVCCMPELILHKVICMRHGLENGAAPMPYLRFGDVGRVMNAKVLQSMCRDLARCVDSDTTVIRERAIHTFEHLLAVDDYCRRASLLALSKTRFSQTLNYKHTIEDTEVVDTTPPSWFKPLSETSLACHWDTDGKPLHIKLHYGGDWACCYRHDGAKYTLKLQSSGVLELHIPRGSSFSAEGHRPLSAGIDSTGRETYIAWPVSRDGYEGECIAVANGAKPEELRMHLWDKGGKRKKVVPSYIVIYVLRYAPESYSRRRELICGASNDGSGLHPTGPYSWKPWVSHTGAYSLDLESGLNGLDRNESEFQSQGAYQDSLGVGDDDDDDETTDEDWETAADCESVGLASG